MTKIFDLVKVKMQDDENNKNNVILSFCTTTDTSVINLIIDKNTIPEVKDENNLSNEDLIAFVQLLFYGHVDLLNNWLKLGQHILETESYSEEELKKIIHFTKYVLGYEIEEK